MRGLTAKPIARVSSRLGSSLTSKRIRATGKRPNGGASASSMPHCTNCASSWNAPSPGRINSSVCCCALRPNTFVILGSNLLPSRSSISGSFVEAETCNQFYRKSRPFRSLPPPLGTPTFAILYMRPQRSPKKVTMRRLLVFQHVPFEILGTLNSLLKARGFRIRYANFGRHPEAHPKVTHYNGLVVLGGPMNVDELAQHPHLAVEVQLIGQAIEGGIPVLGICLGAQLIAKALGAPVYANGAKEIGWYEVSPTSAAKDDPLFRDFGAVEKIFQWHGDTFELPAGAVQLAASRTCPRQAFRYGTNVYGFQFHLEVDEPLIERWLRVPAHRDDIERLAAEVHPDEIRRETRERIAD